MLDATLVPSQYDILLLDLHAIDLRTTVAQLLNVGYLQTIQTPAVPPTQLTGIVWGSFFRVLVSCPVTYNGVTKTVIFLVDTVAPATYLSDDVSCLVSLPHYILLFGRQ